jgi:RHS repeat-associated protein
MNTTTGALTVCLALACLPLQAGAQEFRNYYLTDVQGSPVVSTDAYGTVKWTEDYRPYGERIVESSYASTDGDNERWFTGARQSDISDLVHLGQRFYDPVVGRFLSIDPVAASGDGDNFNRYWYAANDPANNSDPSGLYTCSSEHKQNCPAVESGLARARQVHGKMKAGPDKTDLGNAIAFYGKPNQDNDVDVTFVWLRDAYGETTMNKDGSMSIQFRTDFAWFGNGFKAEERVDKDDVRAGLVVHEGLHGYDNRLRGRPPHSRDEVFIMERRGYGLQAILHQIQNTRAIPPVWKPEWATKSDNPNLTRRSAVIEWANYGANSWEQAAKAR